MCDVASKEQVEQVVNRIEVEVSSDQLSIDTSTRTKLIFLNQKLGTPTILINCAAMSINKLPFHDLPTKSFSKTISANLLGPVHTIHSILPRMILNKRGASIVNFSSVVAHLYPGGLSDYTASKAGLSALHHCLEAEARYYGYDARIKFFLVGVGQMETPLFNWMKTPNAVLAPVLRPKYVSERVIATVESGYGRVIRLPGHASWVCLYDALPALLQWWARHLMGFDDIMAVHQMKNGQTCP
jgi:NAD(P)-dependent dehydrogenase (short-subunit alcohol dehydrogenase family)